MRYTPNNYTYHITPHHITSHHTTSHHITRTSHAHHIAHAAPDGDKRTLERVPMWEHICFGEKPQWNENEQVWIFRD